MHVELLCVLCPCYVPRRRVSCRISRCLPRLAECRSLVAVAAVSSAPCLPGPECSLSEWGDASQLCVEYAGHATWALSSRNNAAYVQNINNISNMAFCWWRILAKSTGVVNDLKTALSVDVSHTGYGVSSDTLVMTSLNSYFRPHKVVIWFKGSGVGYPKQTSLNIIATTHKHYINSRLRKQRTHLSCGFRLCWWHCGDCVTTSSPLRTPFWRISYQGRSAKVPRAPTSSFIAVRKFHCHLWATPTKRSFAVFKLLLTQTAATSRRR